MSNINLATKLRRKQSIRKKISGTEAIPRLSFYKSLQGLSIQAIDDTAGKTLFSHRVRGKRNIEAGKKLAQELAEKIGKDESLTDKRKFVFDRNGGAYHGVIKAFCETFREAGFKI